MLTEDFTWRDPGAPDLSWGQLGDGMTLKLMSDEREKTGWSE